MRCRGCCLTENEEKVEISAAEVCYRAFQLMNDKQYAEAEKLLASNMSKTDEDSPIALFHSALGVLYKLKGEFKIAWRHYQRAEKLLPNDPALKIISARLLIEQFAEYDQAIRKAKKVLDIIPGNVAFEHQAYTTMGLAYCRLGKRKFAIDALEKSMREDFNGFISAKNIDLNLVEAILRKGWNDNLCHKFLKSALEFANKTKEVSYINLFQKLNDTFISEYKPTSKMNGDEEVTQKSKND